MDEMKESKKDNRNDLTKRAKIVILQILKEGYIVKDQWNELAQELGQEPIVIEVIDKRENVE